MKADSIRKGHELLQNALNLKIQYDQALDNWMSLRLKGEEQEANRIDVEVLTPLGENRGRHRQSGRI